MLEKKLIVGRYINFNQSKEPLPKFTNGDFVLVAGQFCYLQESTGVFTKVSTITPGFGAKAHRNFKWLPWIPGALSEIALAGVDVLTGPMTGCWLTTYRKANGVPHCVHLGTDDARKDRTDAVNQSWNAFATAHEADVIGGFNPSRHWDGDYPDRIGNETPQTPKIFGLFTTDGKYYIMITYVPKDTANVLRIAGLQEIDSVSKERLKHVDLPGK